MDKLLVNAPDGTQQVVDVGEGGGYFDPALVLWDTRIDGPMPQITLGGMVRVGGSLVYNQARMDQTLAVLLPPQIEGRCNDVDAECGRRLSSYSHDFGPSYGVLALQLRNADDKANWLTLKDAARDMIVAGYGSSLLPLRTAENVTLMISASQVVQVLASMAAYGSAVLAASWAHKDTLRAMKVGGTIAQVSAYDITSGWPA